MPNGPNEGLKVAYETNKSAIGHTPIFLIKSVENGLDISIVTARLHKWPRVTYSKARSTFQE